MTSSRSCCARRAKAPRCISFRATTTNSPAIISSSTFGEVQVSDEAIHVTADGRQFLVMHGDQFDGVVKYAKWLAHLGDHAYTAALALNRWFNWARRNLGYDYWSLSAYLKHKVKNAVQFIARFEAAMADEARHARRRRRRLRPYPPCRAAPSRRHLVLPTTATGWKAARPWSNISMGGWKFSGGPNPVSFLSSTAGWSPIPRH